MGPNVVAACHDARSTGNTAAIGSLDQIADVIAGSAGTHITAEKFRSDTSKAR